jgi:hypothetical protein
MRLFICNTIKARDYTALTYKNQTVAKYKNNELTIGDINSFSPYVLQELREFIIGECRWVYAALNYPLTDESFKEALLDGIKKKIILCNNNF